MKKSVAIAAILLLILAFGINYAVAADDPPMGGDMKDGGCSCGMMKGGMKDGGCGCGMMKGGDMKDGGCGCGMMKGGMMHGDMMGGGMHHDEMMERAHHMKIMLMQLGLDEKQKAQVDSIMTSHMKDVIKKKADLQIAKVDLKSILSKDPMDMKAAESKLKEIEAMKTALMLAHLNAHQEIKLVLTPEQQKKMKEMMEMHMMGGMKGGGMMCGGMKDGGCCGGMMKDGGCCGGMMKGDMMKGDMMKGDMMKGDMMQEGHHDHEKMMK